MDVESRVQELLASGDAGEAATVAIQGFGPEILGYLETILRDPDDAREVFSQFSEDLWKGLPGFRGECSLKGWAYKLAWSASCRFRKDTYRRRRERMRTSMASRVAASVVTSLGRSERIARLRADLTPEEQTLLVLRLDKELPWKEVAHVLSAAGEEVDSAAVRKRFERLKDKLAEKARTEGLLD